MASLFNRAGMSTATTGSGTITLGSALAANTLINLCGFLTFADAGVSNGNTVPYLILDSNGAWEYGVGTYTASGTTLSRTLGASSTGSLLNLSGSAQVFVTARKEDLPNQKGPTIQTFTSGSGTYTTPSGAVWLRVRMVGGGGGGSGGGTGAPGNGGNGGTTTFDSLSATGGGGGPNPVNGGFTGGPGGSAAGGDINAPGQPGNSMPGNVGSNFNGYGGNGGSGLFGAGGLGGGNGGAPGVAARGNGAGGGGAGGTSAQYGAMGGGAGGYCEKIINSPAATYSYAVGVAGTTGTAGTGGAAGGAGTAGLIIVEEHYNW